MTPPSLLRTRTKRLHQESQRRMASPFARSPTCCFLLSFGPIEVRVPLSTARNAAFWVGVLIATWIHLTCRQVTSVRSGAHSLMVHKQLNLSVLQFLLFIDKQFSKIKIKICGRRCKVHRPRPPSRHFIGIFSPQWDAGEFPCACEFVVAHILCVLLGI